RGEATAGLRGRVRDLLQEGGLKSDAVEAASDLLEEEARKSGHRLARVSHREERQGDRLLFVYEVAAGELAQVSLVRLEGEGSAGLERVVQTGAGAPLVDRKLSEDARALTQALEESGHP